jgi:hypothetical protein
MTMAQWLSFIVLVLWPILWHLASPLGMMLTQKLPEKQRTALAQFADMAVRNVEQASKDVPNDAKKQIALTIAIRLFKTFHIPLPPAYILDVAIEAAVSSLPPTKPKPSE